MHLSFLPNKKDFFGIEMAQPVQAQRSQAEQALWEKYNTTRTREASKKVAAPSHRATFAEGDFPADFHKWGPFNTYLGEAERIQQEILDFDAAKRAENDGAYRVPGMKKSNFAAWRDLASLVGNKNQNIRFNPTLMSAKAAQAYIQKNIDTNKDPKAKARWKKWAVVQADLDDKEETPDNVIVLSDKEIGRIRAIDGYSIGSVNDKGQNAWKNANRNLYDIAPTAADRAKIKSEEKKFLRAYYRKYPTVAQQATHNIADFEAPTSGYQNVRAAVKEFLNLYGIAVQKTANGVTTGNVSAPHFMAVLAKLSASVYQSILKIIFGIQGEYDFNTDPLKLKSAAARKIIALQTKPKESGNPSTLVFDFLTSGYSNGTLTAKLLAIGNEINAAEGGTADAPVFVIAPPKQNGNGVWLYQVADTKAGVKRLAVQKGDRAAAIAAVQQYLKDNPAVERIVPPAVRPGAAPGKFASDEEIEAWNVEQLGQAAADSSRRKSEMELQYEDEDQPRMFQYGSQYAASNPDAWFNPGLLNPPPGYGPQPPTPRPKTARKNINPYSYGGMASSYMGSRRPTYMQSVTSKKKKQNI
jgi:hypothetical protein